MRRYSFLLTSLPLVGALACSRVQSERAAEPDSNPARVASSAAPETAAPADEAPSAPIAEDMAVAEAEPSEGSGAGERELAPPPVASPSPASRSGSSSAHKTESRDRPSDMDGGPGRAKRIGSALAEAPDRVAATGAGGLAIAQSANVRAGEWDDNQNFRDFARYLGSRQDLSFARLDVSVRRFMVVMDQAGKGVPNCEVSVSDAHQKAVTLTTTASGRALLFPRASGLRGDRLFATARCLGETARSAFSATAADGLVTLRMQGLRRVPARPSVDLAFVLDTTGSMSEEIEAVKATISRVARSLEDSRFELRIGLVEFKDRSDSFVTRVYPMSTNLSAFAKSVEHLQASGGGDTPESVNEGLSAALGDLAWDRQASVRMAFLVGDAPPQLGYGDDVMYTESAKRAAREGVQLFTIAASGMDALGQVVWRQLAQYTGGTNLFVLRGGAGPQSTGAGDAESGCGGTHENYTSGNLDRLIEKKVRDQLALLHQDPTRIAGLFVDEKAKPCSERVVLAK